MSHFNIGDQGQRYEVWYFDRTTGEKKQFGWTNEEDGGALIKSARLMPSARDPWVVDRQAADLFCEEEAVLPPGSEEYPD